MYLAWFWHFWRFLRWCQSGFCLVRAWSLWCLQLSTQVFGSIRAAKANPRQLSVCAKPMRDMSAGQGTSSSSPPTHPISCVASHMSHARNVIIPTPLTHPIKSVASNMCARATQQLRSVSHVCTCKERHHPPPHQPSPTPQHAIQ